MKFTFETTAYIKDGNLMVRNRTQMEREALASGLTEFEVVLKKKTRSRSLQQNRWWWLCMSILGEQLGYRREEMHEVCKMKFLKRELVDTKSGEVFEYLKSTTELTTTEFSELIESVIQWSAEQFQIVLPMPGEQLTIEV